MKKLYLLLGLVENHQMQLAISKERFVSLLKIKVGSDQSSSFDVFSGGHYDYRGEVGLSGFYLRRLRGFMSNSRHFCKAFGTFREENNQLIIEVEFRNFPTPVYFYFILSAFFLLSILLTILGSLFTFHFENLRPWIFNFFSVSILVTIVGFVIRNFSHQTIEKMKIEMENNFQEYLTQKI
jgi:hypothetical protein